MLFSLEEHDLMCVRSIPFAAQRSFESASRIWRLITTNSFRVEKTHPAYKGECSVEF